MNAPSKPRKRGRNLTDEVVASLSRQIESGAFPAGTKLPSENMIVQQEGVSRTVVREAISRLQAAQLVQTRHGIGTFVLERPASRSLSIDPDLVLTLLDVMAVLEFRTCVESEAAAMAASRRTEQHLAGMRAALAAFEKQMQHGPGDSVEADIEFHLQIGQASGNHYFLDILRQLGTTIIPRNRLDLRKLAIGNDPSYPQRVHEEHLYIFRAIERKEPEAARAAMRTHLTNSRERLRKAHEDAAAGK
ncbi:FadR/GntR family transcriptional regulator [Orrella sp. JC864]|uniref:FadR/GntR family transcriptional regulator n=1 Tax=Orrella sp. JC864 TaxID=3120298 RepID=UPI0012BCE6A0